MEKRLRDYEVYQRDENIFIFIMSEDGTEPVYMKSLVSTGIYGDDYHKGNIQAIINRIATDPEPPERWSDSDFKSGDYIRGNYQMVIMSSRNGNKDIIASRYGRNENVYYDRISSMIGVVSYDIRKYYLVKRTAIIDNEVDIVSGCARNGDVTEIRRMDTYTPGDSIDKAIDDGDFTIIERVDNGAFKVTESYIYLCANVDEDKLTKDDMVRVIDVLAPEAIRYKTAEEVADVLTKYCWSEKLRDFVIEHNRYKNRFPISVYQTYPYNLSLVITDPNCVLVPVKIFNLSENTLDDEIDEIIEKYDMVAKKQSSTAVIIDCFAGIDPVTVDEYIEFDSEEEAYEFCKRHRDENRYNMGYNVVMCGSSGVLSLYNLKEIIENEDYHYRIELIHDQCYDE